MIEAGRRGRLVARTAIALLALAAAPAARAACTPGPMPMQSLTATDGSTCTASGFYGPTTGPAIWAEGVAAASPYAPSHIDLAGVTITTTSSASFGLYATGGGTITGTEGVSVTTEGDMSAAVFATGTAALPAPPTRSTITLTDATIITEGVDTPEEGVDSPGVVSRDGGSVVLIGGSVDTKNEGSPGLIAFTSSFTLPTLISTTGMMITTEGGPDPVGSQSIAVEVQNPGATITLTDDIIKTFGVGGVGVLASDLGVAMLNGATTLTTTNDGGIGLFAEGGGIIEATGPIAISTGSVALSTGASAYGVNADGAGSQVTFSAATTVTTNGTGAFGTTAYGLYASNGGMIDTSGAPAVKVTTYGDGAIGVYASGTAPSPSTTPSTITIGGVATITTNGGVATITVGETEVMVPAAGVQADSGGQVTLSGGSTATPNTVTTTGNGSIGLYALTAGTIDVNGATSVNVLGASSTGVQATAASVTATGALNVTTSQASSVAFALGGTSPSIIASGGGTVSAAGNAINFTGATTAVATFDNFHITSASGDLIFADPSTATINFNNTVATANGGNLLNATAGSTIAFNANASTLTGAIQTDSTSTTNVSLTNGTDWTMTGSSTMTGLNLSNSAVIFSPSGGFKTLTVGSLVGGTGANVTLNTQLAGAQNTDQIIINGGSATGTTALTIKNASASNAGAATTGAGIPVVVVTNGGTTSTTAFQLTNNAPIVAGGYEYTLGRSGNDDWYLTSSPAPTHDDIQNSVNSLAQAQFNNMVTTRLLGSLLLGANEQVSGCDCGGGFAGGGSFSLGSHGRWALSDSLTLLAGASWDSFYQDGTNVSASPIVAASLRYDPSNWGTSRPFVEFGAALSPYITASYTRYYNNGFTPAMGVGSAIDRGLAVFGRVGWVARFTPIDEGAVLVDLVRGWQEQGGYTEVSTAVNPFPATVSNGIDREDVVRVGAQYTHLLFGNLETNVNGAVAHGFDSSFGSQVSVLSFGSIAPFPILNSTWVEYGGRLGYRFSRNLVVDAFAIGTLGGEVGKTLHVGVGARYAF
jgi:hypothetical protein